MSFQTDITASALRDAHAAAVEALLSHRTAEGNWEGRLSSSALSTAVAAFALHRAAGGRKARAVARALDWLVAHQNRDGGFGDTARSPSNLSTSVLCWCALSAAGDGEAHAWASGQVQQYVAAACGSLDPGAVACAVAGRYGHDRTFSAPILTMAAMAGKLGDAPACWRLVPQLPFELGWLSHAALRRLKLPVVSYALPALIAIGQVRHARRPSRNPIARLLRVAARDKTLTKLCIIQPESGGFLEAAPLTAFVLMSLAELRDAGLPPYTPADEVMARAEAFLLNTVRPDGSWPIDTNLAAWVTTLSVNALPIGAIDDADRLRLRGWLLDGQYRVAHPYTQAEPGGWAWTNLPGGVPDADDTAGALRALHKLAPHDARAIDAACLGCRWLIGLQNDDGGMPTFCRGWGKLDFDRSCDDLTAHAAWAWSAWLDDVPAALRPRIERAVERALGFLLRSQGAEGQWTPLWFGNQAAPDEANPVYGTARVVAALAAIASPADMRADLASALRRGCEFLLSCQAPDGGFGPCPPPSSASIEETAVAVDALAAALARDSDDQTASRLRAAVKAGAAWLLDATGGGQDYPAAAIGLYFARLWYSERLYPISFTVSALTAARKAMGS